MNDFFIGATTTIIIILLLEIFHRIDRKFIAALILSGIPFIYIGFTWGEPLSITSAIIAGILFIAMAYVGYKKNYVWLLAGLFLHGAWDLVFPHYGTGAPHGYDIFCLTIDWLLIPYFYIRLKKTETICTP
jgi:hypothetical protein